MDRGLQNLNFPDFIIITFFICQKVREIANWQINKKTKKVREIQIIQIFLVYSSISYIFCALVKNY